MISNQKRQSCSFKTIHSAIMDCSHCLFRVVGTTFAFDVTASETPRHDFYFIFISGVGLSNWDTSMNLYLSDSSFWQLKNNLFTHQHMRGPSGQHNN